MSRHAKSGAEQSSGWSGGRTVYRLIAGAVAFSIRCYARHGTPHRCTSYGARQPKQMHLASPLGCNAGARRPPGALPPNPRALGEAAGDVCLTRPGVRTLCWHLRSACLVRVREIRLFKLAAGALFECGFSPSGRLVRDAGCSNRPCPGQSGKNGEQARWGMRGKTGG